MLSFIPAGILRSIAEYLLAVIPGAALLFFFFVAAEILVFVLPGNDWKSISFVPVICIMAPIAGTVSTLLMEKIRPKPITLAKGAAIGAASGFIGSLASVAMLATTALLFKKFAFGQAISGAWFYLALAVVVLIESILGLLGGAITAHLISNHEES